MKFFRIVIIFCAIAVCAGISRASENMVLNGLYNPYRIFVHNDRIYIADDKHYYCESKGNPACMEMEGTYVRVYDLGGKFIKSFVRRGEGQGEIKEWVEGISAWEGGIALMDTTRVMFFDNDDKYIDKKMAKLPTPADYPAFVIFGDCFFDIKQGSTKDGKNAVYIPTIYKRDGNSNTLKKLETLDNMASENPLGTNYFFAPREFENKLVPYDGFVPLVYENQLYLAYSKSPNEIVFTVVNSEGKIVREETKRLDNPPVVSGENKGEVKKLLEYKIIDHQKGNDEAFAKKLEKLDVRDEFPAFIDGFVADDKGKFIFVTYSRRGSEVNCIVIDAKSLNQIKVSPLKLWKAVFGIPQYAYYKGILYSYKENDDGDWVLEITPLNL
ncbi:MAG: hypothetical protein NTW04_05880 [Elusimicrobia bacterium]|nr:hypothetical protein [Elusimicrobiota bacterium]